MRVLTISLCSLVLTGSAFAQQKPAPAYLISEFEVRDDASYKKFREEVSPIIKAHGGQLVARAGNVMPLIGEAPKNVTVVMFESLEKARAYSQSSEYKALAPLRDAAGKFRVYVVEGTDTSR